MRLLSVAVILFLALLSGVYAAEQNFQPIVPSLPPAPGSSDNPSAPKPRPNPIRWECTYDDGDVISYAIDTAAKTIDVIAGEGSEGLGCVATIHISENKDELPRQYWSKACGNGLSTSVEKPNRGWVRVSVSERKIQYSYSDGEIGVFDLNTQEVKVCPKGTDCVVGRCHSVE